MKSIRWCLYSAVVAMLLMVWSAPAGAVAWYAPGNIGDVLMGDSFDVRSDVELPASYNDNERGADWQNFLEFQNTSDDWVAAHLRFREAEQSLEVWDHPILLSPKDVFWCYLERQADGTVKIASSDFHTLYNSGLISKTEYENPTGEWSDTFSTFVIQQVDCNPDAAPTTEQIARTQLGHFSIIGMFSFDGAERDLGYDYADDLIHDLAWDGSDRSGIIIDSYSGDYTDGSVNIFDVLHSVWGAERGDGPFPGPDYNAVNEYTLDVNPFGDYGNYSSVFDYIYVEDCRNVLKGTMEFGDSVAGQFLTWSLDALMNFRTQADEGAVRYPNTVQGTIYHRDKRTDAAIIYPPDLYKRGGGFWGTNPTDYVYTDTAPAYYLNPDWATAKGPTLRDGDHAFGANLATCAPLDFNAEWSLDEVDFALAKDDIWSFYFNDDPFDNSMGLETDITLTFVTKHLHENFCAFPYWYNIINFSNNNTPKKYLDNVETYRCLQTSTSEVCLNITLWDTEEASPQGEFGPSPDYATSEFCTDMEVLVQRIEDLPDLNGDVWKFGHILFNDWQFFGERAWSDEEDEWEMLPVIGHTMRMHNNGSTAFRSSANDLHWNPVYDVLFDIEGGQLGFK